jgi:hypothetical protein
MGGSIRAIDGLIVQEMAAATHDCRQDSDEGMDQFLDSNHSCEEGLLFINATVP